MRRVVDAPDSPWATVCQNCGAALGGRFCAECGQRAIPPHPTVRELAGDAWGELVGWDGKFLRTVRLLVSRPGELTRAAIEGRRARYITPVRLYLICSVLYFVVSAAVPLPEGNLTFDVGVGVDASPPTREDAAFEKVMRQGVDSLTPDERALVEAEIASQPSFFRPMVRAVVADFAGFRQRLGEILPRALFLLVPVLAAVLAVFYRRRHYPEHLYAALHLQTFVFLVATVAGLTRFTGWVAGMGTVTIVAVPVIVVAHTMMAQRRVYAESWPKTAVKAVAVAALYGALWALASLGAAIWAAIG
jgi:hypothetical protein